MIPFNRPYLTGNEERYITEVLQSRGFAGDGPFSRKCAGWLEKTTGCRKAVLVPSGTAALEMMMILAAVGPGDEVIMPSFTFSSTANAVVLRGATPVFVDIRPDTLNIDETQIEKAITKHTKALCPVHYAGVPCEMDTIAAVAAKHGLLLLPDAAQAIMSSYHGQPAVSLGNMSAVSFHETKNLHCGEGGALLINDPDFVQRAEIVMEKGTDRSRFFRGEIDKYTWVDLGSSMLLNEITAAFLWAQFEKADEITARRLKLWNTYHDAFEPYERQGLLRRPIVPAGCRHNAHIYYILLKDVAARDCVMKKLKERGFSAVFHYIPLDSAKAGRRFCRSYPQALPVTEDLSGRLLRMPLWYELEEDDVRAAVSIVGELAAGL